MGSGILPLLYFIFVDKVWLTIWLIYAKLYIFNSGEETDVFPQGREVAMSRDSEEFSLDDILAEFRDTGSGIEPVVKEKRAEIKEPEKAQHTRLDAEPALKEPISKKQINEDPIREEPIREEPRQAVSGGRRAGSKKLLVCSAVVYAALLIWGLFNVHPGSVAAESVKVTAPPQVTQSVPSPSALPQESTQPDASEPPETPEPTETPEPKPHYTIPDGAVVAPKANPDNFGSVPVGNASELTAVIEKARESGLLGEDEKVIFDPNAEFNTGSYYKDIQYYYDETILAIAWKQIVDGNTVTCMEVKVADASQFRRKLTGDAYGSPTDHLSNLYKSTNAVAATNADFYQFRDYGVVVYDGVLYRYIDKLYIEHNGVDYRWYNCLDNCFVTRDGDFLFTYFGEAFTQEELQQYIDDNNIAFSLSFGPVLVDDYELQTHYDGWYPVAEVNEGYSRAGIGQVDTLHYLYMSLNHSDEKSARWTMLQFGEFFQSMGVKDAYAFDGGQTSEIIFNGDIYAHVDTGSERWVSDMLYFATALPEEAWNNG